MTVGVLLLERMKVIVTMQAAVRIRGGGGVSRDKHSSAEER
jgi:hypothetical protein